MKAGNEENNDSANGKKITSPQIPLFSQDE
jgi:hypothetical protein